LQQFNPATLSQLQYKKLELYRTTFFDSKSLYHSASYGHPMLDYGTLAVTVLRLDVGGIEERDVNNVLLSSDMSNAQTRLLLGYSASLHPALAAGINLKVDNQSFGGYSGSGIGLDLGFLSTKTFSDDSRIRWIRGGLSINNLIEPSVKLDQEDVADPLSVTFGASAGAQAGYIGFVTLLDVVAPRYSPYEIRFGQEISYNDLIAFRFGYGGSVPTVGGGVSWRNVSVDYAYRNEDLGSNHRIAVTVRFGASLDERRAAERAEREAELDRQINQKMSELESSQLSQTLARADALFDQGDYGEAAAQYELALLWDTDNQRARPQLETCRYHQAMERARSLIEAREYLEALYQLRRALIHSPGDAEATSLIAECNQQLREQADHTEMINRMLKQSIDLYASRRFVEAQAGFREILNLDPDNRLAAEYDRKSSTNIRNQKQSAIIEANGLADRGEYAAAISTLVRALRLDPDDGHIRERIRDLQQRQIDAEKARERKALGGPIGVEHGTLSVGASMLRSKYNEGLRNFEKGDFDAAVRRLHEVWVVEPDYHNVTELLTKAYLFIGMKQYSEENYRDAIVTWERALTVDPDNVKAKRYLRKAKEEASRLSNVDNE
jgi:tetratricopeptide (TPR) repeat protein